MLFTKRVMSTWSTEDYCYCQCFGKGNEAAVTRKRRFEAIERQRAELEEKTKMRKLEEDNLRMSQELQELQKIVRRQEDREVFNI
jgi:hypothetical protein